MRSLRDLQRDFGNALLAPGAAEFIPPGLGIYAANVAGNWLKALAGAYPIARKIVGERFFEGLARAYSAAHPSRSGDLNDYGADFPAFVADYPGTRDLPYLPDVARMEWLAHRAHFAADAPRFDPARLAGVSPAKYAALPLRLAPPCGLLVSGWPLARLWEIHQDGYAGDLSADLAPAAARILVYRPDWKSAVAALAPGEFALLGAAQHGETLGDALETALAADPQADAANALARWVSAGVLVL